MTADVGYGEEMLAMEKRCSLWRRDVGYGEEMLAIKLLHISGFRTHKNGNIWVTLKSLIIKILSLL